MLDLINNYVYLDKNKEKYYYERLNIENININDLIQCDNSDCSYHILKKYGNDENYKLICDKNDKVVFKKYFIKYPITLVCQKYKYTESIRIIDILYELLINQIVSEYVILDKVPFYLINICNFNININDEKITKNTYLNETIRKTLNMHSIDDNSLLCMSVYEHYNSYTTFRHILLEKIDNKDILDLIFQVLFSFAFINYKLSNFRHNDFNIDSFVIVNIKNNKNNELNLKFGETEFQMKNYKYLCKLFNYRKSSFDFFKNNVECVLNNPSYDMYVFFKSLYDCSKNTPNFNYIKIIIDSIIPLYLLEKNFDENKFIVEYSETILPQQLLLKNNFFTNYILMSKKYIIQKAGKHIKDDDDSFDLRTEEFEENDDSDSDSDGDSDSNSDSDSDDENKNEEENEEEENEEDEDEEDEEDDNNTESTQETVETEETEDTEETDNEDDKDEDIKSEMSDTSDTSDTSVISSDNDAKNISKQNKQKLKNKNKYLFEEYGEEKIKDNGYTYDNKLSVEKEENNPELTTEGDAVPAGYNEGGNGKKNKHNKSLFVKSKSNKYDGNNDNNQLSSTSLFSDKSTTNKTAIKTNKMTAGNSDYELKIRDILQSDYIPDVKSKLNDYTKQHSLPLPNPPTIDELYNNAENGMIKNTLIGSVKGAVKTFTNNYKNIFDSLNTNNVPNSQAFDYLKQNNMQNQNLPVHNLTQAPLPTNNMLQNVNLQKGEIQNASNSKMVDLQEIPILSGGGKKNNKIFFLRKKN